ncbi:MAG: TonB-dependent receptor domain-containing protein [Fidelibacterota bacterium]
MKRIWIILLLWGELWAGANGKIAGVVTDQDGAPLIGANVMVEGTILGAATNDRGEYYIINIPPGYYNLRFTMIGYQTVIQNDILVKSDLTSRIDVTLSQTVLESEQVVEVVAERPLIQKDATSSIQVMDSDQIINMPVENVQDILATQAGFTTDENGELHVRGGRSRELLYMVDGILVRDPMGGDFVGSVNQNAIQELTVISGTFNAEYGQAMSGVVNIITREGGEQFTGRLDIASDNTLQSEYHAPGAFSGVEDSLYRWVDLGDSLTTYQDHYVSQFDHQPFIPFLHMPGKGSSSFSLGGPTFLPHTTFYTTYYYHNRDSYLPHGANINQDVLAKVTTRMTPQLKLTGQIHSSQTLRQGYSHPWKYLPANNAHLYSFSDRASLSLNHSLSRAMFYTVSLARQWQSSRVGVKDFFPEQYERNLTGESVSFIASGTSGTYSLSQNIITQLRGDLTWQINPRHLTKAGFSIYRYDLGIHNEQDPWTDGVNFYEDTTFTPVEMSFYVQDKIEFDYLIINLGLRWDYLDPNASMWRDVGRFGSRDPVTNEFIPAPLYDVAPAAQWSPRIGIAYPVTDKTVFHFSYGHFFQSPTFDALYYNAEKDLTASLPLVGNPRVEPQKTISFETGLKQELSPQLVMEFNIWSKDIRGLLSTLQMRYLSTQYVIYSNTDYSSVKGLDISFNQRLFRGVSGSIKYTYSIAKGNNSNPIAGYFSAYTQEEVPHQEYFLDFDQRHDISVNIYFSSHNRSRLYGNLLFNVASGLPYTPYVDPAFRVDINSARKPWTYSLDARINRKFSIGAFQLTSFLEITNLTNHQNILFVYSRTGKPFDPGASLVGTSPDANHNPAHVGPGREIKLGAFLEW